MFKMAEKAIKKLDEQLNCAICLDTYTDPKILQCFHTCCTKCLINLVVRDWQGQLTLTCPTCRQVIPIPPNGVRCLQSAFQINEFIAIRDDLKKAKDPINTALATGAIKVLSMTLSKLPIKNLEALVRVFIKVAQPCGVAFNQKGEVVISEGQGHCVSVFNPCGEKLRSFGEFRFPCGLAVDHEDNILVADSDNHCIQKFTAEGQLIKTVGSKGGSRFQLSYPHGITFNPTNNKVYVVDENNRVQVMNSDLTFSSLFRTRKSQFNFPYDVACDSTGNVYVADHNNHRIQVFTAEGKFLRMFDGQGDGEGELNLPNSITIDANDRVYVGDCNDCVSVFTSGGQFITSFGRKGNGPGEFNGPHGLAVDAIGVVYVCDCFNNRVQLFK